MITFHRYVRVLAILLMTSCVFAGTSAAQTKPDPNAAPNVFVQQVADLSLEALKNDSEVRAGNTARINQIVDDVLDMTVDSAHLGKTAGKDLATEKTTWPAVYGLEQSQRDAGRIIEEAFAAIAPYGDRAEGLKTVARYLVERKN